MTKLILASNSPRRKELMKLLGIPFEVVASNYEENLGQAKSPKETVEEFSHQKAFNVASKHKDATVLGADTVVVLGDQILGKPKDDEDGRRILRLLSGTEHVIITGFTIIDRGNHIVTKSVESRVKLKDLTEEEINAYIATGEHMDKAGAYAVQERAGVFVEHIIGDLFNIIGLPLKDVREELSKINIKTLE